MYMLTVEYPCLYVLYIRPTDSFLSVRSLTQLLNFPFPIKSFCNNFFFIGHDDECSILHLLLSLWGLLRALFIILRLKVAVIKCP